MIYYIHKQQEYKSILPLNEEVIFENVPLVAVTLQENVSITTKIYEENVSS